MRLPWELLVLQSFMSCLADDYALHGPVFLQEPSHVMFSLDSEEKKVKLTCEVKGNPKPHIRWKLNGTDVDLGMDFRYSVVEGSLLINNPNKTQDAGTYQCIATNSFGTIVSREARLQFACPQYPGCHHSVDGLLTSKDIRLSTIIMHILVTLILI